MSERSSLTQPDRTNHDNVHEKMHDEIIAQFGRNHPQHPNPPGQPPQPAGPGAPNEGAKQIVDGIGQIDIGAQNREENSQYIREETKDKIFTLYKENLSRTIHKKGKDGQKGACEETRDAIGSVTKLAPDGKGIEVIEPNGTRQTYPNGEIDMKGNVTFTSKFGTEHERLLDGTRTEKSKYGEIRESSAAGKSVSTEKKISDNETLKTRFVDGKKVQEVRSFEKPVPLKIKTSTQGEIELNNVERAISRYDKTGKEISQEINFYPPSPTKLQTARGEVSFEASTLRIDRSGSTPIMTYYSSTSKNRFDLTDAAGNKHHIDARCLSVPKENSNDPFVLRNELFEPEHYIRATDQLGKEPEKNNQERQVAATAKVHNLMARYNGAEGNSQKGREDLERELIGLGRDALPAIRDYAKLAPEDSQNIFANKVLSDIYALPLSEDLAKELQDRSFDLYLARSLANNNTDMSPEARKRFESFIEKADKPLPGYLDETELTTRHDRVFMFEIRAANDGGNLGWLEARESQIMKDIQETLEYKKTAQVDYALALSRTNNEADLKVATDMLTKLVKSDPNINNHAFIEAVKAKAPENINFRNALKTTRVGSAALASADELIKKAEELKASKERGLTPFPGK